jgi:hypothetical protein
MKHCSFSALHGRILLAERGEINLTARALLAALRPFQALKSPWWVPGEFR